jgi:hypothetical protein
MSAGFLWQLEGAEVFPDSLVSFSLGSWECCFLLWPFSKADCICGIKTFKESLEGRYNQGLASG